MSKRSRIEDTTGHFLDIGIKDEIEENDLDPLMEDFGNGNEEINSGNGATSGAGCCVNLWNSEATASLISLYKKYINMVGRPHMKSMKEMFEKISIDLRAMGHDYATQKVENKWRVLERKYKKHEAIQEKTVGRIPAKLRRSMYFEHKDELDEIFGPAPKKNINSSIHETIIHAEKSTQTIEEIGVLRTYANKKTTGDLNADVVEKIADKVAMKFGKWFVQMEKNKERRHQEYSAIKLNELEVQKQLLEIRKQELELKKKLIKISEGGESNGVEEIILS